MSNTAPNGKAPMKLDPITLEIIIARLQELVATMEHLLFHSGYSTILRESHDGSCTLLDTEGNCIEGSGGPLHLFSYLYTVRSILDRYPIATMKDGDCFISNDPYLGGTLHVPDIVIITPIFVDNEVIAFSGSHAHKPDVGGLVPGSSGAAAREIFHEGLILPGVKFWTKDGVIPEVLAIIRHNCRIPEIIEGDLRAQVGCTLVGADQVRALCKEYGTETIKAAMPAVLAMSEKRVRDGIEIWPDGEAEAEAMVDHDGVDLEKPLRIHVKVVKKGRDIAFDYSATNDQVKGPTNLRPQVSHVAAVMALVTMLDPTIPFNDGMRRVIHFINPEGKITNPKWPAPINSYFGLANVLYSTCNRALAQFNPGRAVASPGLGLGAIAIGYDQNRTGRKAVQYELFTSAQGGKSDHDGSSGTVGFMNVTPNTPIEVIETEFPIRVKRFEWIADSCGAGTHRGGIGNRKEYELLGHATTTLRLGHQFKFGGWGIFEGQDPPVVRATLNRGTNHERPLKPLETIRMEPGETFMIEMPGGGGYGDPKKRPPEEVLEDVLNGYVSIETAERDYGVAIYPDTMALDKERTAALRAR
jgi:N-methylhydantoinase B